MKDSNMNGEKEKEELRFKIRDAATFWKNAEVDKREYWRGKYHGLRSVYTSFFGGDDWLREIESKVFFLDAD